MAAGLLKKMSTRWTSSDVPVAYSFRLSDETVPFNDFVGHRLKLRHTGRCQCISCGREIKKTFQQGYCYPCTLKLAETDICIIKPELCHYDQGTCRDREFAQKHCFIPHIVYLAVSSDAKVGITREYQKLTRWADQGAAAAIELARVPGRKEAGLIEIELARHIADKTDWRKLLRGEPAPLDLVRLKKQLAAKVPASFQPALSPNDEVTLLRYPVQAYPVKINSYNFDKNPRIDDKLTGIKGQYLLFENGVINVRKYQGYEVELTCGRLK